MNGAVVDRSMDAHAYRTLAGAEPVFAGLIDTYGHPCPFDWHDGGRTGTSQFAAMLLHVVGQQISAVVAFRVYDRIIDACGGIPTAAAIVSLGEQSLRSAGLSAAKAGYALSLAQAQSEGALDIESMSRLDDDAIIAALTTVRGIGLWSAQTFLIHNMARPDVLPAGDLGVRRAVAAQWNLPDLPAPSAVAARGAAWAPYRSYAAALLWRSLVPAGEESDPKARALQRQRATTRPAAPTRRRA